MLKSLLLKRLSMHNQAAISSLHSLLARPFSSAFTILILSVVLAIPTFFWVLSESFTPFTKDLGHDALLRVYLNKPWSDSKADIALQEIKKLPEVKTATLITPEQGLKLLANQDDLVNIDSYLAANPLPGVIVVEPTASTIKSNTVQNLQTSLSAIADVEKVQSGKDNIQRLQAILQIINQIGCVLIILLGSAVVLIMMNTLKLIIASRQDEIKLYNLMGATQAYIRRPILYIGLWYGLFGAVLAIIFVNFVFIYLHASLQNLANVYDIATPALGMSVHEAYILVLFSMFLAWCGALIVASLNKSLSQQYF